MAQMTKLDINTVFPNKKKTVVFLFVFVLWV